MGKKFGIFIFKNAFPVDSGVIKDGCHLAHSATSFQPSKPLPKSSNSMLKPITLRLSLLKGSR